MDAALPDSRLSAMIPSEESKMSAVNDQQQAQVTINGVKRNVPVGQHSFSQIAAYLGVPSAKTLTVTDPTPRSSTVFNPNHSLIIQGGETITSA